MLILDPGEEAFSTITGFAVREGVSAASLTALGAFSGATVGRFDLDSKNYRKIPVAQQCEMLSGIGDIAIGDDGKPSLHIHVVLGLSDGSTRGGHLLDGLVQPTQRVTFEDSIYCFARGIRAQMGPKLEFTRGRR